MRKYLVEVKSEQNTQRIGHVVVNAEDMDDAIDKVRDAIDDDQLKPQQVNWTERNHDDSFDVTGIATQDE